MGKLIVEMNTKFEKAGDTFEKGNGIVMITPPVGEDYWQFLLHIYRQAIENKISNGCLMSLRDEIIRRMAFARVEG